MGDEFIQLKEKKKKKDVRMTDAVHFYYQIRDMLKEEANENN